MPSPPLDPVDSELEGMLALMAEAEHQPAAGEALADAFVALEPAERRELWRALDLLRREVGASAAAVWGPVLTRGALVDLWDDAIAVLVAEGGEGGVRVIEDALARSEAGDQRERLVEALSRVHASAGPGQLPDEQALAFVSYPDGQAAFHVVLAQPVGQQDRWRVDAVVARGDSGVRDGFTLANLDRDGMDQVLVQLQAASALTLVACSPGQAVALLGRACRAHQALRLPHEVQVATDQILRWPATHLWPLPDGEPAADWDRLLDDAGIGGTWFFDHADLEGAGLAQPPAGADLDAWLEACAAALDTPVLRARIAATCGTAAEVARFDGRLDLATGLKREGAGCARSLRDSTLVRTMLRRTLGALRSGDSGPDLAPPLGDLALRETLRRALVQDTASPRRADLVVLDLAEVFAGLDFAWTRELPGLADVRPDLRTAAWVAGARCLRDQVQALLAERATDVDSAALVAAMVDAGLPPAVAAEVLPSLVDAGLALVADVCDGCSQACWDQPEAPAGPAWTYAGHPSRLG